MELDSQDNPHISYYDETNTALKYARWTGSAWHIETVDNTGYVGQYTSLALDSSGYPHISYYDSNLEFLKYARWTGSGWSIETADRAGDVHGYTSIGLDSNGHPHISYYRATNTSSSLQYAHWTGQRWILETADEGGVGQFSSIAINKEDRPFISYFDSGNGDLKLARRTSASPYQVYLPVVLQK